MDDAAKIEAKITEWIKERVKEAGAHGIVVGLSGGVDSSLVAALSKKAFPDNTLGIIMPCNSNPEDKEHGELLARTFDIPVKVVDLAPSFRALYDQLEGEGKEPERNLATANLKPRLRMTTVYYFANKHNYLVAGTGNKTEELIGYFTKFGDGGVDILPIGDLYKKEVRELARHMGIPDAIIDKVPSAGLWDGQTDEGEMGITYDVLDKILEGIESGNIEGLDADRVEKVGQMIKISEHKRNVAPVCELG